jgi:sarcosine oxidase subunit beta
MVWTPDVVVVGAGVIGCGVALELARAGRRVLVLDKGAGAGAGSTSASSAIVRFSYSTWEGVALSWESKHGWEKWRDHLGVDDPSGIARFHRVGGLQLDVPGSGRERVLALFDRVGVPYEVWDAQTLAQRIPALDTGRYHPPKPVDDEAFWADADGRVGGCWTPDAGFVDDPQLAAHNLMVAAQAAGVRFRFREQVVAVERDANRVGALQLAGGERVPAPVVVNAAGPWSAALNRLAEVGDDFTVTPRPLRQEVHHVDAPEGFGREALGPFVADGDLGTYFRPTPGGGLLLGGVEPECDPLVWLDDADDYNANVTADVWRAQVLRTARRLPELAVPGRPRGIAGVYDVTPDWTPIYDRTSLDGYYVAIGTSGNQFKNAPTAGLLMARLVQACESGHDHDADPVQVTLPRTGLTVDLAAWSRRRPLNADSSFSVLG